MKTILLAAVLAAFAATSTFTTVAADKPAIQKKEAKARALPFQGKLAAVDQDAKTIKIGERVFHVVADTKIMKDGAPATLADAKVGDQVGLSYRQGEDKALNLVSLRVGPKPDTKKEEKK